MCGGAFNLVEDAAQMRHDHHAHFYRGAGSHAAGLVERRNHAVQRIVLAKEENVVLAAEVIVEVSRRKCRGCCDVTHTGLRKAADSKLSPRGSQNFEAPGKVAPSEMAVAPPFRLAVQRLHCSGSRGQMLRAHSPINS